MRLLLPLRRLADALIAADTLHRATTEPEPWTGDRRLVALQNHAVAAGAAVSAGFDTMRGPVVVDRDPDERELDGRFIYVPRGSVRS